MGCISKVLNNPITTAVTDIALALTPGGAPFIPLANAAERTAGGLASGESFGKALGQGAISGGEAFAGQELIGAAAHEFPQTGASFGLDTSGNSLTDVLGVTNGAGSLTGAGTLGGDLKSLFSSGGASMASTPGAGVNSVSGKAGIPTGGTGGGGVSAAAAPVGAGGGDVTSSTDWLDKFNSSGGPSSLSTPISSNIGSGTTGTPSVGNTANFDINGNISGSPSLSSTANAASTGGTFLDKAKSAITSPGALISGAGVALDAIKGNKVTGAEKNLQAEASQLGQQGSQLGSYLQNGTLPAGLQQTLNQATNSAKATIRSKYASMGMSGSSTEQQELQAVDERAQAQGGGLAIQLLQTGINETGLAGELYKALMNQSMQTDTDLSGAISSFAAAAGGGNSKSAAHA